MKSPMPFIRMLAALAPVEILIVENSAHNWKETGGPLHPSLDDIIAKTAAFMRQHLDRSAKH